MYLKLKSIFFQPARLISYKTYWKKMLCVSVCVSSKDKMFYEVSFVSSKQSEADRCCIKCTQGE